MSEPTCIGCNRREAERGSEFCGECMLGFDWHILQAVSREAALLKATRARVIGGRNEGATVRLLAVMSSVSRVVYGDRSDDDYDYVMNEHLAPLTESPAP